MLIFVEFIFNTSILRRKNLHLNLEHFRCHLKQPFQYYAVLCQLIKANLGEKIRDID